MKKEKWVIEILDSSNVMTLKHDYLKKCKKLSNGNFKFYNILYFNTLDKCIKYRDKYTDDNTFTHICRRLK